MTIESQWYAPRVPNTGPLAPNSSGGSALCTRGEAVFSDPNNALTTLDLTAALAALGVSDVGSYYVAMRVQLNGVISPNGNTTSPVTQFYPMSFIITNGVIVEVYWNATVGVEASSLASGFLDAPDAASHSQVTVDAVTPAGKSVAINWNCAVDTFDQSVIPAAEVCLSSVTGVAA